MAKATKKKAQEISYSLVNLDVVDHFIKDDYELAINSKDDTLTFQIGGGTDGDLATKTLKITFKYSFFCKNERIFNIETLNEFKLHNVNDNVFKDTVNNDKFIKSLFQLALHHTRGIQATLIKGKKMDKFYIPLYLDIPLEKKSEDEEKK